LQPENRRRQRAQTSNRRDCCFNHFLGRRRGPVGGRGMLCRGGGVAWGWRRRGQIAGTRHHSGATLLRDYVSSFDSSDPNFSSISLCRIYSFPTQVAVPWPPSAPWPPCCHCRGGGNLAFGARNPEIASHLHGPSARRRLKARHKIAGYTLKYRDHPP
jgi:hypothetical protein